MAGERLLLSQQDQRCDKAGYVSIRCSKHQRNRSMVVHNKNSKGNVCRVATIFNYLAWGGNGLSHILDFWSDSEFSLHLTYNPRKEEVAAVSEGID